MKKLVNYIVLYLVLLSVPVLSVQASATPISKLALSSLYQGDDEDDEEEDWYMDWIENNEMAWEFCNQLNANRSLYPGEVPDEEGYIDEEQLKEARDIGQYADYKCVIKWVAKRDTLREQYQKLRAEVEAAYNEGQLGPDGTKRGLVVTYMNFIVRDVDEVHYAFLEELNEEYDSHHYVYGGSSAWILRDGDPMSVEYTWIERTDGYVDYYFYSYKDLDLTGYAISTTNQVENPYHVKLPDKWALYGYYCDEKDTREYNEIPISDYTLLDSKGNYNFPWLERVRKVFKLNHSGHYNRYVLRFYFTGKEDETIQRLAFTQFELLEGNVVASDDITAPDPEMPELTIVQNESPTSLYPWLRVWSDVGQPGSPFEFLDKNVEPKIIFRHVDPQYGTFEYSRPTRPLIYALFDEQGYLDVPLFTSWNVDIFDLSYFPRVPNHACDVIMTYKVVEKATGRIYEVTDTIPYYIRYPAPIVHMEDENIYGTGEHFSTEYNTSISNLDFDQGCTIDVECDDYTGGSYGTRHFSYEFVPTPELNKITDAVEKAEYLKRYNKEWITFSTVLKYTDGGYLWESESPCAYIKLPIVLGEKDVKIRISATRKEGEATVNADCNLSYARITAPEKEMKITFSSGIGSTDIPHDISEWRTSNEQELNALVSCFTEDGNIVNAKRLNELYEAYAESSRKVLNITAPAEWGRFSISQLNDIAPQGSATVYLDVPPTGQPFTYNIEWKKVGISKELTFTAFPLPDNLYAFRPVCEGKHGEQSVSIHYELYDYERTTKSVTAIGRFGSDDSAPDCLCFKVGGDGIAPYSFICMRDNTSQATAYINKTRHYERRYDSFWGWLNWETGDLISKVQLSWDENRRGYMEYHTCSLAPLPRTGRTRLTPITQTLVQRPKIRLIVLDENGESNTIKDAISIKTAYVVEKEGSGITPIGTSPDFNPFHQLEEVSATAAVNGIIELELPVPAEDEIIHPFIEIRQTRQYGTQYCNRLISEFTDPEIFADYINKGIPYPVVLTPYDNWHSYSKMWSRPVDSDFMTTDRVSTLCAQGSELSYEGGKESLDAVISSKLPFSLGDFMGRENRLTDGTIDHVWPLSNEYFFFAPRIALERRKPYSHWSNKVNYYKKDLIEHASLMSDGLGREMLWPATYTGFAYDYGIWTCTPHELIPAMRQGQEKPNAEIVELGYVDRSITDNDGKPLSYDEITVHDSWQDYPPNTHSLALIYNTATEEVNPEELMNDVSNMSVPGYDPSSVPDDPGMSKVRSGFTDFNMATPGCLPFVNLAVTHAEGEYRIRSSFELNAMDFGKPAFGAWDKLKDQRERVNDMARYLTSFQTIKSSVLGNYIDDVYGQDDGIFVGFKGFSEMAVIKDYQNNVWRPYLTGFGARLEASAQFSWKFNQPPLVAKFVTRGAASSGIMLLNPDLKDAALQAAFNDPLQNLDSLSFNPYSNHNFYLNSSFDLALTLQGGIGFDAGFIAAHGGLVGRARAVASLSYVNRPYLTGALRQSGGTRFDLSASLSAYVYFKLLFLKYSKEWPLCHVEKTFYLPDDNSNPWKSDPNLNPELKASAKSSFKVRPLTMTNLAKRRKVSVIGSHTISNNVDIFANPIYMNGGSRLAFFNIGDPANNNDDRVMLSGEGCNVSNSVGIYNDDVPSFTYHAASAGNHQIVAVQRLGQELAEGQDDINAAKDLTNQLQIVASVGDNTDSFRPTVISSTGVANQAPKAAIAQNGNAAIVWSSGNIILNEYQDEETGDIYSDPVMEGDIVVSQFQSRESGGNDLWTAPVKLATTSAESSVLDYVIATGGKQPLILASIPGKTASGEVTSPAYLMTVSNGFARRTSLGIQGAQHQLIAVYEPGQNTTNHFIGSCLVNAGENGETDIMLFDILLQEDGIIRHTSLGHLGLTKQKILSYRLVSPKDGASGVDGLGIIWNQHEQENTDDETLDAIPYNRSYVARINRRGNYVYLSHAAQVLNLEDDQMVADMTAYLHDDHEAGCPVVTAAFCIGETQRDGASTSAEIIEKRVSLNNEILWLEEATGLSGLIDRINGTEIKIGVRNIGLHTIRKFTVNIDGHTYEQMANLAPSERSTVTIQMPSSTDFSGELPFTLTAHFYDVDMTDASDKGTFTGTASTYGIFRVNVVDMCTSLSHNRFDKETQRNVIMVSVSNLNPMALKPGNSVKVSLFTDAMGDTQYGEVGTYTIPASELYNASKKQPLVKTVSFFVPAPKTRTIVYAICHTMDSDGNVVFDQNSSDNTVIISLAPSNTDNGGTTEESGYSIGKLVRLIQSLKNDTPQPDQDYNGDGIVDMKDIDALVVLITEAAPDRLTVEDLENPQLKVRNAGESIEVEGLNPDKDLKVFDATGQLINWTEPNAENASVKLNRKGTVIVVNDGKAGVIRH